MSLRWLGFLSLVLYISAQPSVLGANPEPPTISWERVLEEGPWHEPGEPGVVAYDDSLWLFGGMSACSVWRSENGKDWSCVQPSAPWCSRWRHCAFAFRDSLWVHGGEIAYSLVGDVWRSDSRGIEWKRVFHSSKGFNEQMEHITRNSNNVSGDATTPEVPWEPRCGDSVTVHKGMLWMAGGLVPRRGLTGRDGAEVVLPADSTNDVWCSKQGEKWEQVTTAANWEPRNRFGFFSLGGKLWVVGGAVGRREDFSYSDEVWSSKDGRKWTLVGKLPCGRRSDFGICHSGQGVYLLGGFDGSDICDDVWFSSDAITWKCLGKLPDGIARMRPGVCWFQDGIWLIGGTTGNGRKHFADVWVGK